MDQPENLTLPYNPGQQKVQLTGIGDGNDGTQEITITATSSNTTIMPNPAVDYTWPASTGELIFTPAADKSGKVTVTVTLTDNGGTAGGGLNTKIYSFTVTIDPIGIEDVRQENALYPNPATKQIRLDVPFADAGWKYIVMNTAGVTVKNGDVPVDNEGLSIDVSDLIPGWYLLQVTNGKEMISQPFQKR